MLAEVADYAFVGHLTLITSDDVQQEGDSQGACCRPMSAGFALQYVVS